MPASRADMLRLSSPGTERLVAGPDDASASAIDMISYYIYYSISHAIPTYTIT